MNKYEIAVLTRNEERMKYKKILEDEKIKINQKITKIIDEFDNGLFRLFKTKLKYNSALIQENLKVIRLSKIVRDSVERKQEIEIYR